MGVSARSWKARSHPPRSVFTGSTVGGPPAFETRMSTAPSPAAAPAPSAAAPASLPSAPPQAPPTPYNTPRAPVPPSTPTARRAQNHSLQSPSDLEPLSQIDGRLGQELEGALPPGSVGLHGIDGRRPAGIRDEDVDRTETGGGTGHERRSIRIGGIGRDPGDLDAVPIAQRAGDLLQRIGPPGPDQQVA